jgi:protein YIPF6|eukprot:COSAG03_NODE_32_length_18233_cov_11.266847_12_plen_221_part_00
MADLPAESTIDEPVRVTLMRDANRVARRMKLVLKPHGGGSGAESHDEMKAELRNWDLWGPLVICMLLAILLSIWSPADQAATVFCAVFGIVWVGAAVVTLNAQLLEGRISFFQSVCVLGYCVFPLCISALFCQLCQLLLAEGVLWLDMLLRSTFVVAGGAWATRASSAFLTDVVPEKRRALAAFPLSLFYFSISMMVFIQTLTPSTPLPSIVPMDAVRSG